MYVHYKFVIALVKTGFLSTNHQLWCSLKVNDIKFHPIHGTLASMGSDATTAYWDKDARAKLKSSEVLDQPITKCCFNSSSQIFAYSTEYDWSKGHEYNNPAKKPQIFLRPCFEDMKPKMS